MYAFKSETFLNSFMVDIVTDAGDIIFKMEFKSFKGAKAYLDKVFHGCEWINAPWNDERLKAAQAKYKHKIGIGMDGKE